MDMAHPTRGTFMKKIFLLSVIAVGLLLLVSACNDDDDCIDCPDAGTPDPTMANIWPHADGTAWTFDVVYRELETIQGIQPADTAPLGTEELHDALQAPMPGMVTKEEEGLFRFTFDGTITTQ